MTGSLVEMVATIFGAAGENDTLLGGAGDDEMNGARGDDELRGGPGRDIIYGGRGRDSLFGGGADDFLRGEEGSDHLQGDGGFNTLTGGEGEDVFVFSRRTQEDRITDFEASADRLQIHDASNVDILSHPDGTEVRFTDAEGGTHSIILDGYTGPAADIEIDLF